MTFLNCFKPVLFTLFFLALFITSCDLTSSTDDSNDNNKSVNQSNNTNNADDNNNDNADNNNLDSTIYDMDHIENDEVVSDPVATDDPTTETQEIGGIEYNCTVTPYKFAPEYNEMIVMDPTSDVFFAGALINGESIQTGEYTPIITDRKPITLSISLENISGKVYVDDVEPTLSRVRQAVRDMLDQELTGEQPAVVSFEVKEVYSKEQLQVELGAHFGFNAGAVSASIDSAFSFDQSYEKNTLMIKYIQKYYTVDIDLPSKPSDFFNGSIPENALNAISPMYISTVTYGRIAVFSATSTHSHQEIKASLDAAFQYASYEGDLELSTQHQKVLDETTFKGSIVGGSGSDAAATVSGFDDMWNYIKSGGVYSKTSPGAPIAYKMRYLKDNSVTKIVMGTEYNVRDCDMIPPDMGKTVTIDIQSMTVADRDGSSNNSDPYGYFRWDSVGDIWDVEFVNALDGIEEIIGSYLNTNPRSKTFTDIQGDETITLSWDIWDSDGSDSDPDILAKGSMTLDLADLSTGMKTYTKFYEGHQFDFNLQFTVDVVAEK